MPGQIDQSLIIFYLTGILSIVGGSYAVLRFSPRCCRIGPPYWLFWIFILGSSYMLVAQLLKSSSLHFYMDFSHWSQLLHNIATTGKPYSMNQEFLEAGALNYFSMHFVPLTYLLAIPFKFLPYNETIILLNFFLVLSAAVPLYKLALTFQDDKRFGLFMIVLLFWYPTFQYTVMYEFEVLRFSIPVILWMLYFLKKERMLGYYACLLLAVLVREEVGLTIMMFGVYLFFFEKKRQTGLISALIGFLAFAIITQIIMPSLRGGGAAEVSGVMRRFSEFGVTPFEVVKNALFNPIFTISIIMHPIKVANVFMYFIPLLFLPLLAPAVLISILASFGVVLLTNTISYSSYMLYYLSPSIPFIFYAFIKAWPRFLKFLNVLVEKKYLGECKNINSTAMLSLLSCLFISNLFFGPSPLSLQFWFKQLRPAPFNTQNFHYSVYKVTKHHQIARDLLEAIPESAIVSAPYNLFSMLSRHKGTIAFPRLSLKREKSDHPLLRGYGERVDAEYVIFDKTNNGVGESSPAYRREFQFDLVENDREHWELLRSQDGYFLFKRK